MEKIEPLLLKQKLNLEKLTFYLLILLLPTQLGKHFWPSFSQVLGIRIDYLSSTLYLTDLLILLLLMLWLTRNLKRSSPINLLRKIDGSPDWNIIIWLIFIIYLIINILLSNSLLLGLYGLAKILELSLLGFYIARNLKTKKEFSIIALIFSISIIGESLLGNFRNIFRRINA